VFTWLPKAGTHKVKFFVDPTSASRPHGRVLESDETNNIVEMSKTVAGTSGLPGPSAPMAFIAIMSALGVAWLLRRRN